MSDQTRNKFQKEVQADIEHQGGCCARPPKPVNHTAKRTNGAWHYFQTQRVGICLVPALALLLTGVVFCIAAPVFLDFRGEATIHSGKKRGSVCSNITDIATNTTNTTSSKYTLVIVYIQTKALTGPLSTLSVNVDFRLHGRIVEQQNPAQPLVLPKNQSLVIYYGHTKNTYTNGQVLGTIEATDSLTNSGKYRSYAFYPFDEYDARPFVVVYIETVDSEGEVVSSKPVGTCVLFRNRLTNFELRSPPEFQSYERPGSVAGNQTHVRASIKFQRTRAARFFSLFIVILMWCLSMFQLVLCLDHLFLRPRRPGAPTIVFSISMLFALPAMRNAQPDAPPIGVSIDVLGFFWNMSITAVAACLFLAGFVGYYKHVPMDKGKDDE